MSTKKSTGGWKNEAAREKKSLHHLTLNVFAFRAKSVAAIEVKARTSKSRNNCAEEWTRRALLQQFRKGKTDRVVGLYRRKLPRNGGPIRRCCRASRFLLEGLECRHVGAARVRRNHPALSKRIVDGPHPEVRAAIGKRWKATVGSADPAVAGPRRRSQWTRERYVANSQVTRGTPAAAIAA